MIQRLGKVVTEEEGTTGVGVGVGVGVGGKHV